MSIGLELVNEYNPVDKCPKTFYAYLKDESCICWVCKKEIKDNYCYFNEDKGVFNCLSCVREGKLADNTLTGVKIPLAQQTFKTSWISVKLVIKWSNLPTTT